MELENEIKHVFVFYNRSCFAPAPQLCKHVHAYKSEEERSVVAGACGLSAAGSGRVEESRLRTLQQRSRLQNLEGIRPSVLCSSARVEAGAVVLCSSFLESRQALLIVCVLCSSANRLPRIVFRSSSSSSGSY